MTARKERAAGGAASLRPALAELEQEVVRVGSELGIKLGLTSNATFQRVFNVFWSRAGGVGKGKG